MFDEFLSQSVRQPSASKVRLCLLATCVITSRLFAKIASGSLGSASLVAAASVIFRFSSASSAADAIEPLARLKGPSVEGDAIWKRTAAIILDSGCWLH